MAGMTRAMGATLTGGAKIAWQKLKSLCIVSWTSILPPMPSTVRNKVRWRPGQEASLASHVRTWGLSEAYVLYWIKYLWHCWAFSSPHAVIRRPGNCAPRPYAPSSCWGSFTNSFATTTQIEGQKLSRTFTFGTYETYKKIFYTTVEPWEQVNTL